MPLHRLALAIQQSDDNERYIIDADGLADRIEVRAEELVGHGLPDHGAFCLPVEVRLRE